MSDDINFYNKRNKKNGYNYYNKKSNINSTEINIDILPSEISVGTILFNLWDSKVLLIQGLNKFFGFPKGHIEVDETEHQTMIRELHEETNIDLSQIKYKIIDDKMVQSFYLNKKYYQDGPKHVNRINIFYITLINEDPNSIKLKKNENEILKLGWFTFENAKKYLINSNSNQLEFLEKAEDKIRSIMNNYIISQESN
jgi:8-oxo-dGTP pyrophosphatase MutT (NUDIX family)